MEEGPASEACPVVAGEAPGSGKKKHATATSFDDRVIEAPEKSGGPPVFKGVSRFFSFGNLVLQPAG